jgi:hypothetical protein
MTTAAHRSPLGTGSFIALGTLAIAAVLGVIAVLDQSREAAAFGAGFGIALVVFLSGATIVVGLACLARRRAELVGLAGVAVAGVALDLLVLAIWREIDDETYAKIALIATAWTFFALVALGLTLAVDARGRLSRPLYLAALATTLVAGLVSTYLIANAGDDQPVSDDFDDDALYTFGIDVGDDELLRVLGVTLVLIAVLWFGSIAAQRLESADAAAD